MSESKEFKKKLEKYGNMYEEEVQEMLILTGENLGGAYSLTRGIWIPSANFLAGADTESGEINSGEGELFWLAEEKDRDGWIFDLKPLTIYHIKCRKRKAEKNKENADKLLNKYMLVEVVGRNLQNEGLLNVLSDYRKPVFIEDGQCGRFELERIYGCFSAVVPWNGEECNVSLDYDGKDIETAKKALAAFKEIYADIARWDRDFRDFAARKLTELANEWQEDNDFDSEDEDSCAGTPGGGATISEQNFSSRILISEFSIDEDGEYTVYYDDDDMFYGHVILVTGSLKEGMTSAEIAG